MNKCKEKVNLSKRYLFPTRHINKIFDNKLSYKKYLFASFEKIMLPGCNSKIYPSIYRYNNI